MEEQATIMLLLTYAAIAALVWFWLGTSPKWATSNIVTTPLLPEGWTGVLGAVPYALWFLVIIETVALAPEEAEEPQKSIPIGMTLGQLTLIVLVILTVLSTAAAYPDFSAAGSGGSLFPLSFVFNIANTVEPEPDINAPETSGCSSSHVFTSARKTYFSNTGRSRSFTSVPHSNSCAA